MPYPKHFLGVFGGRLGFGGLNIDEWQCSIRLARTSTGSTASDPDPAAVLTNEFKTAVEAFVTDTQGPFSSYVKLEWLKLNEIGPDGRYTSATATNVYDYTTPVHSSISPGSYDPAASLCISWLTANKRGPGHRGRMYVPMPRPTVGSSGRLDASATDAVATSAKTFIQNLAVGGLATAQWGACVVTNRGAAGNALEIQGVAVGDVLDHQLRRRNAMQENYSTLTI